MSDDGANVLHTDEYERLYSVLRLLDGAFAMRDGDILQEGSFYAYLVRGCVDVEFLFLTANSSSMKKSIVVLQCRPFQQRYSPEAAVSE